MNNQQPQMKVDFNQTLPEECEKCGNDTFVQVFKIRTLSALLSPSGQKTVIPIQMFACAECGNINSFNLKEAPEDDTI